MFFDSVIEERDEEDIIDDNKRKSLNSNDFMSIIIRDRNEGNSQFIYLTLKWRNVPKTRWSQPKIILAREKKLIFFSWERTYYKSLFSILAHF